MGSEDRDSRSNAPSWGGDPDKFEEYRMRAELYVDGLDWKSRPFGASRLIARLQGAAWETMKEVSRAERQKLCGENGVELPPDSRGRAAGQDMPVLPEADARRVHEGLRQ